MLTTAQNANLAVRFALELALLASVSAWAWRTLPAGVPRLLATIALPLLVAVIWATVVHGASVPVAVQIAAQIALFTTAALALVRIGQPRAAAAFAVVAVLNAALMTAWNQ
jgi:hypothetical protein